MVEVVSEDATSRVRDYEDKRRDYAQAGIPEYWIVDPAAGMVTVLALANDGYEVAGEYRRGEAACSRLLKGFSLEVAPLFDQP